MSDGMTECARKYKVEKPKVHELHSIYKDANELYMFHTSARAAAKDLKDKIEKLLDREGL